MSSTAALAVELEGLPPPGTPLFLPTILAHVRVLAPSLPVDPVVLQAMLLGVISGGRNVILQTRDDDVQAVARLTALTLTTVFGYTTHRTKFAPEAKQYPPDEIVNALFVPPSVPTPLLGTLTPTSPLSPISASSGGTIRGLTTTSLQHHRSLSRGSTIKPVHARPPSDSFRRSSSYPSETTSPTSPTAGSIYAPSVSTAHASGPRRITSPDRPGLLSPGMESHTAPAVPTITYSPPPGPLAPLHPSQSVNSAHVRTRTASTTNSTAARFGMPVMVPAELPQAVVVSGLEHIGIAAQRDVVQTLRTRELVMEVVDDETGQLKKVKRKLRDGFIVVYVCRLDPRERPMIYKSLLDHFALSASVTLQPMARTALRYRHPSTNTPPIAQPSPRSLAAAQSPPQPFLLPATPPVSANLATTPPAESPSRQAHRVSQSTSTTGTSPIPTSLSPPPSQPSQPGQPPAPSALPALLSPALLNTLRSLTKRANIRAPLRLYLSDLLTATRHAPELDGALLTARCRTDIEALACAGRVLGVDTGRGELVRPMVPADPDDASWAETEAGATQSTESFFTSEANAIGGDGDEPHPNGNGHALPFPRPPSLRSHQTRNTIATGASGTGSSLLNKDGLDELQLDVAEADIARVFPRAVSHRVRVRRSPADEVLSSALCGAVGGVMVNGREVRADDPDAWVRSQVKDVLVQVLADV
ncbi:hypothetical protein CONPUDRAFT_152283 [Coniophora puteana RWD-64-598 SS2]|uniref:Uncharacterized protein n=1 Tax=Coniophora puteana (strain RWD-64-598) TaxID=741705 RepID=A0A5M3MVR5_CONPW|nr:uncharacterized protein CONPUDRAFT_152283 [Coniophora puteana RWD-64-598 SS2]EIW83252.1 hypothetical protein CONPUDRAFT_152283 [Coniophora puteana RWD-64-598 SS2]